MGAGEGRLPGVDTLLRSSQAARDHRRTAGMCVSQQGHAQRSLQQPARCCLPHRCRGDGAEASRRCALNFYLQWCCRLCSLTPDHFEQVFQGAVQPRLGMAIKHTLYACWGEQRTQQTNH